MSNAASTISRSTINDTEIKNNNKQCRNKNNGNINNAATIAKWQNMLRHVETCKGNHRKFTLIMNIQL